MRTALLARLAVPFCPAMDCTTRQFTVVVACITCHLQWHVSLLSAVECCGCVFWLRLLHFLAATAAFSGCNCCIFWMNEDREQPRVVLFATLRGLICTRLCGYHLILSSVNRADCTITAAAEESVRSHTAWFISRHGRRCNAVRRDSNSDEMCKRSRLDR